MRHYIPFHHVEGRASRQAHADLPEGTYEREMSKEGFFGPAAHIYHAHPPTGWTQWEGPLRPRAFDLNKLKGAAPCPWDAPAVLSNGSCALRYWRPEGVMAHLVRNADGDDLLFVHAGGGEFFCDYGHLSLRGGDYVLVPRGTLWRLAPHAGTEILMIEATNGSYQLPDRGLMGAHAIFDPAILDLPRLDEAFEAQKDDEGADGAWQIRIKRAGAVSRVTFPFNPLDAVGWKGNLSVARLNVADIRPLMSHRYHVPPSAHTTFTAPRFVVCTFAPRPFESDPGALKVPFFHNNDDYDEVLFYHAGDFFSRDNIDAGMMTFHPAGFTHGPHPKALKNMLRQTKPSTDEYAVMIDTRDALAGADLPDDVEIADYVESWSARDEGAA
jgi:homogentisate 1,2-dioxygenase